MSAATPLDAAFGRLVARRRPHGIAAVLLPYRDPGTVDWEGFAGLVAATHAAGLDVAVNMDTGFGDLLRPDERAAVLEATRSTLGAHVPFYAGAWADGAPDPVAGYREAVAAGVARGARPVIVQCPALQRMDARQKASLYGAVAGRAEETLAFELSPRFAPHGEIWDDETFARLLDLEGLAGAKHSSLDRATELGRLAARDAARPGFRLYTGNDLAIDMVAYGSDYLLGLAGFAPERFAERDVALAGGALEFLARNDALQHLGNVGFREPIPAYKHSAAQFLQLTGRLAGDGVHPRAPRREGADRLLLLDCARRLGLVDDPERVYRDQVLPHLAGADGGGAR